MSDRKIIDLIRKGKHSTAIAKLYKIYPAVESHVLASGGNEIDAQDIFQDALLIFIGKISNFDFQLSSSISTYLFGICKNLNYENIRKSMKKTSQELQLQDEDITSSIELFVEEEKKYKELDEVLVKVDKKCLKMLQMFYYQKLSMKVIADNLGFKSEASAKTQKYKCLEKARKLVAKAWEKTKLIDS